MSIADRARTGVRLTLLASLLATSPLGFQAPSGDGPLFQAAKAFAKDGDRDRSDNPGATLHGSKFRGICSRKAQ